MAVTRLTSVLQIVRGILSGGSLRAAPDKELLQRFLGTHDESAFEEILHRHGPLVLDVCRGVLANEADAEDAFQATFFVLTHRAGSIRRAASLASWLHGVAFRTALKARAEAARRRQHETDVPRRQVGDQDSLTWTEAMQVLHEELGELSDRHREPLVLCYLLGKTQDDASVLLGLSKATLKRRLQRGRAVLRQRLVQRGLGSAALLVACAWPTTTAQACVPRLVILATLKAATTGAAAGAATTAASASVATSTVGVLKNMLLTRRPIAILTIVLLLGGLVSVASTGAVRTGDDTPARTSPREQGPATPDPMSVPPATAGQIRIVILDPRGSHCRAPTFK
jgi:RNA polymerase sigma factor (sigma-70 family)